MQALNDLSPNKQAQPQARNRLYSTEALVADDFQDIPIIDMDIYLKARETDMS